MTVATILSVGLLVGACGDDSSPRTPVDASSSSASPTADGFDVAAAEAYCTANGGVLVPRVATWNTNADPPLRLRLAGRMTFCEFEAAPPGDTEATRIAVDLVTLYSEEPTIAAIAYLSPVAPVLPDTPSANPAEHHCREGLAGSASFGNTPTVGAWTNDDEPVFAQMEMCVFPDLSAIDAFGLLYRADGTTRGADLASILRYRPGERLPRMFDDG